jgi:hypothetical protein
MATVTKGLWVPLEARAGKEADVARFLEGGRSLVEDEPETTAWFAVRLGDSHSPSSTSSQMTQADRHTCRVAWPKR